jgi:hypothetical protein
MSDIDWDLSEQTYWAQHGSFAEQIYTAQIVDKRERRAEMHWSERFLDYALEWLFPRRYAAMYHCHPQFPDMRLMLRDGTATNIFTKHPLPWPKTRGQRNFPVDLQGSIEEDGGKAEAANDNTPPALKKAG